MIGRRNHVEAPGAKLWQWTGILRDVDITGAPASVENNDLNGRLAAVVTGLEKHSALNIIKIPAAARGYLHAIQVVRGNGDASDFAVYVLDRAAEGRYVPNIIWSSASAVDQTSEYAVEHDYAYGDPGYPGTYWESMEVTLPVIESWGLSVPFANRDTYDDEEPSLYLMVIPTGVTEGVNDFHVKIVGLDLQ